MLSIELKADIRRLWDSFWSGGIANPLTAIEQITYLVFLKRLEDLDNYHVNEAMKIGQYYISIFNDADFCRWSYIKQISGEVRLDHIQKKVFNWMKEVAVEMGFEYMKDAIFVIPSPNLLDKAIEIIDDLFIPSQNQDTLGDIYEYLLSEIAEAGKNGQFRTPRHIIRAMIDLVNPQLGERIADPACGTGGFLVNAYQHILKINTNDSIIRFEADGSQINAIGDLLTDEQKNNLRSNTLYGWDFDQTMVRLGWMNMVLHGLLKPKINYADTLGERFNKQLSIRGGNIGKFDILLANPPFAGNIDKSDIGESLRWLDTNKTELLFIELIMQLLGEKGRAAVIVPEGVLFGSAKAHIALHKKLIANNNLIAIISLPGGVFQPYTGVKTSILVFEKGSQTRKVWYYEVAADGLSLDSKRIGQYEKSDLFDLIIKYRLRIKGQNPAFINNIVWQEWLKLDFDAISRSYFQPISSSMENDDMQNSTSELLLLKRIIRKPDYFNDKEPKSWETTVESIENNNWNLSASRYKPFILSSIDYESPIEMITDLKSLEHEISESLNDLLNMMR
jgi:type I restriction enzyme M protein